MMCKFSDITTIKSGNILNHHLIVGKFNMLCKYTELYKSGRIVNISRNNVR